MTQDSQRPPTPEAAFAEIVTLAREARDLGTATAWGRVHRASGDVARGGLCDACNVIEAAAGMVAALVTPEAVTHRVLAHPGPGWTHAHAGTCDDMGTRPRAYAARLARDRSRETRRGMTNSPRSPSPHAAFAELVALAREAAAPDMVDNDTVDALACAIDRACATRYDARDVILAAVFMAEAIAAPDALARLALDGPGPGWSHVDGES